MLLFKTNIQDTEFTAICRMEYELDLEAATLFYECYVDLAVRNVQTLKREKELIK